MPPRRNWGGAPNADWRIRPRAALILPCRPAAAERGFPIATSSSSAAAPPARPSPRCSPSRPRRRAGREGAPPALSHRRVAAAGQRRAVRQARRARAGRGDRHAQMGRRVRLARARASPVRRVRRRLGQVDAVRLAGAALGARRAALSPRRREGRAHASKASACARSRSTPTARTVAGRARSDGDAAQLARALRRRRLRAATPCSPTSSRCKEKNPRHNSSALYGHFTGAERLPGKLEGNITHLLVRARLVLVHPARRRHDQRRRGLLAVLPEVAQQAAAGVLPRHDRALPGAGARGSTARTLVDERVYATGNYSYASAQQQRRALPDARRRLRLRRPGLLVGRVPGDAERLRRRSTSSRRCSTAGATRRRCGARFDRRDRSAARASSRGSSSASPTRRCASSSCRRRTRSASRKR